MGGPKGAPVIGNSGDTAYPLENPVNDAGLIGNTWGDVEFDPVLGASLAPKHVYRPVEDVREKAANAEAALACDAGHRVQARARRCLFPVDRISGNEDAMTRLSRGMEHRVGVLDTAA